MRKRKIGAAVARRGGPYRGEHCQAAKRAAADTEGHSAAAELGQPGRLRASVYSAPEMKEAANRGGLFVFFFAQGGARSRIYVVNLMAYRAVHRFINMVILRSIFGGKALNAVSSLGASVQKERHKMPRWLQQSGRDWNGIGA